MSIDSLVCEQQPCAHCRLGIGAWPHNNDAAADKQFCCYGCFVAWQAGNGGGEHSESAAFLIRLGIGGFLGMNVMLFSLLLYSGTLGGVDEQVRHNVHLLLWVLATPVVLILGGPFYREFIALLIKKRAGPATLIAVGTLAAYGYSVVETLQRGERVYFDTCVMVLVLFTLGRYIEATGRARAARSLRAMTDVEKQTVIQVTTDVEQELPLADVITGMQLRVLPGAVLPVDGIVVTGTSQVEESVLTGEPGWIDKSPASEVMAGSTNGEAELIIQAGCNGLESKWITLCRQVRHALSKPTYALVVADKVAAIFVPVVLILALIAAWLNHPDGEADALMAGLAVLVVACPCALGLAVPLATSSAIAILMEQGILIRNGDSLESLASVGTMAFDKTGTLTDANIRCSEIHSIDPALAQEDVLCMAGALAVTSRHPLSLAVIKEIQERCLHVESAVDVCNETGNGITGQVHNTTVHLGHARWFAKLGIPIVHSIEDAAEDAARHGKMVTFVSIDSVCRSMIVFNVAVHPLAQPIIAGLHKSDIDVKVLTGDGALQTEKLCRTIGVSDWAAQLSPADKESHVVQLVKRRGPAVMVGDGVNDTLAMLAADVGIAVGGANDIASETADVVLPAAGITRILPLLKIARDTQAAVVTNLLWAFGYNAIAIVLAMMGWLEPVFAAALMAGSSLVVVANTLYRLPAATKAAPGAPGGSIERR